MEEVELFVECVTLACVVADRRPGAPVSALNGRDYWSVKLVVVGPMCRVIANSRELEGRGFMECLWVVDLV